MTRIPRIRCNYCDRRIPASSVVCPNCNRNPRAFYWRRNHTYALLTVIALVVVAGALLFLSSTREPATQIAAPAATATATETRAPITVVIVATRAPVTSTSTRPASTVTRTATPRATATATRTATFTRTARTPRATNTPSRSPTPQPVTAPLLVAPVNDQRFGRSDQIVFEFSSPYKLKTDEWYRVQVDYLDTSGATSSWCGFDKAPSIALPKAIFAESSADVRRFTWQVAIVRALATKTSDCNLPFEPLAAPSAIGAFYWY